MKVKYTLPDREMIYTSREKYNPWLRYKARKRSKARRLRAVERALKDAREYKGSPLVMNRGCCGRGSKESCVRPPCPANLECWPVDEVRDIHDREVIRVREARDRQAARNARDREIAAAHPDDGVGYG